MKNTKMALCFGSVGAWVLSTLFGVIGLTGFSTQVFAHDPGYQDFYNMKQGTMEADSGCRLLLCLGNPKGPMSEPKCVQDVQSMYTEIALSATYGHGPAWIPQCTGLNGFNMSSQLNKLGRNAGSYVKHQRFNVLRLMNDGDGGSRWVVIYSSLRSPTFFPKTNPVSGLLETSETPVYTWNAVPKGMGRTMNQYNFSSFDNNATTPSRVTAADISKNIANSDIRLFERHNYSDRSASEFEQAVIASTQVGVIQSAAPRGSFFQRGDKIALAEVAQIDGNHPEQRVKPTNQFTIRSVATVAGADGKPTQKVINNTVSLQFGTTNDGTNRMTQDISGFNIGSKGSGGGSAVNALPAKVVDGQIIYDRGSAKPASYSINENTGVVVYEDAGGQRVATKPQDFAMSSTSEKGIVKNTFSYKNERGETSTFDPNSKMPVNSDTAITN